MFRDSRSYVYVSEDGCAVPNIATEEEEKYKYGWDRALYE
jgi:hypothetical protein